MRPGLRLGPFVLDGPIATGGMGRVWAAHHHSIGLPVAIKVLSGVVSEGSKAALWAEARAVARIEHPGVIRLLDIGEVQIDAAAARASADAIGPDDVFAPTMTNTETACAGTAWPETAWGRVAESADLGGTPFLVMEKAHGTLGDRLPLTVHAALQALRDILRALAAAHARGIVHRDVKPANVLRIGGRWVLADFGIAAALGARSNAASGTPLYMAPEQIVGDAPAQGPWTDLYAVGCLAHALLTGAPPFAGPSKAAIADGHRFGRPPPLPADPDGPAHLPGWVDRLLAKDPARRFRCAADALAALDGAPVPVPFAADWRSGPREPPFDVIGAGLGLYPHRQLPLVGRADARARLWSALGAVHGSGDLTLAMVLGAPGIGKSRLVEWLVQTAAEQGLARVVRQRGDAPLGVALRQAMRLDGVADGDMPAMVARALADADPTAAEVDAITRLVVGGLHGQQATRGRAAVMAQWLGLWALERPVIWWVDDAHQAGEALSAVEQCLAVDEGAGLPVLVVIAAREESEADGLADPARTAATAAHTLAQIGPTQRRLFALMRREGTVAVALDPLPALDTRRLIRTLLHLDGAVADTLERRAAGHPGFAVRWVADRIEHGQLVPGPTGFGPASGAALHVPVDLADVWRRRAMALATDETQQRLLELAAALGPAVNRAIWHAAGGDVAAAKRLERQLDRRGLLRPVPDRPGCWRLVHSPLVEALAAASVRVGRWPAINRRAAEASSAADAAVDPALLARLYRQGERPYAAVAPLLRAAEQALERGAYALALAWLDERAALFGDDDPRDPHVDHLRIRALRKLQRPADALSIAERLWADPPEDPALWTRIQIDSAALLRQRGRLDEGRAMIQRGLESARAAGDSHLISAAASTLGRQLIIAGQYDEAEPIVAESLAHAFDAVDRASALFGLGLLACRLKQWPRARATLEECRDTWLGVGRLHGASDAENQLAEVDRVTGDLDAAGAHYASSIRYARLAGISTAVPLLNQGFLALERHAPEEARRLLRQAAAALLQEGNALGTAFAQIGRLQAAAMLGDAAEWAAALAMPAQPEVPGWSEMLTLIDETVGYAEQAGFDPAPLFALRAQWAG